MFIQKCNDFDFILYSPKFCGTKFLRISKEQVDELPSKNQPLCAFCVTCIVLVCVVLFYFVVFFVLLQIS